MVSFKILPNDHFIRYGKVIVRFDTGVNFSRFLLTKVLLLSRIRHILYLIRLPVYDPSVLDLHETSTISSSPLHLHQV